MWGAGQGSCSEVVYIDMGAGQSTIMLRKVSIFLSVPCNAGRGCPGAAELVTPCLMSTTRAVAVALECLLRVSAAKWTWVCLLRRRYEVRVNSSRFSGRTTISLVDSTARKLHPFQLLRKDGQRGGEERRVGFRGSQYAYKQPPSLNSEWLGLHTIRG